MFKFRLRELREKRRFSQEELAQNLHVSQSTISAYEVGERTPDVDTLIAIADFFAVSLDFLVGVSNENPIISPYKLTVDELECLHKYKRANVDDRKKIKAYMDGLLSK